MKKTATFVGLMTVSVALACSLAGEALAQRGGRGGRSRGGDEGGGGGQFQAQPFEGQAIGPGGGGGFGGGGFGGRGGGNFNIQGGGEFGGGGGEFGGGGRRARGGDFGGGGFGGGEFGGGGDFGGGGRRGRGGDFGGGFGGGEFGGGGFGGRGGGRGGFGGGEGMEGFGGRGGRGGRGGFGGGGIEGGGFGGRGNFGMDQREFDRGGDRNNEDRNRGEEDNQRDMERMQERLQEQTERGLRRLDANGNRMLDPEEIPAGSRAAIEAAVAKMGLDLRRPIPIESLAQAIANARLNPNGRGGGPASMIALVPPFGVAGSEVLVGGFDKPIIPILEENSGGLPTAEMLAQVAAGGREGRGSREEQRRQEQAAEGMRRFAQSMIQRNDANQNGTLERDAQEWDGLQENQKQADKDGNGIITLDEFVAFFTENGGGRGGRGGGGRGGRGGGGRGGEQQQFEGGEEAYTEEGAPRSRTPGGTRRTTVYELSAELKPRDANFDGQVSMAEYSSSWNDVLVKQFKQYDTNNDGVITPAESVAGSRSTSRASSSSESQF